MSSPSEDRVGRQREALSHQLTRAKAYGRSMYERAVIAEMDLAAIEDRLNEALAANDALRSQLGLQTARRCEICRALAVPGSGPACLCSSCSRAVASGSTAGRD